MEMTITILGFIATVLGSSALTALVTNFFNRKLIRSQADQANAQAVKTISDAATSLVAPLQEEIQRLRAQDADRLGQINELKKQVSDLRCTVDKLTQALDIKDLEVKRLTEENRRLESSNRALSKRVKELENEVERLKGGSNG